MAAAAPRPGSLVASVLQNLGAAEQQQRLVLPHVQALPWRLRNRRGMQSTQRARPPAGARRLLKATLPCLRPAGVRPSLSQAQEHSNQIRCSTS